MTNLDIVSAIRQSLKALDFEIKDLRRVRRGLAPFEYTNIQGDLSDRLKAKRELLEWLEVNNFTI
jgi:hypothetical protein